MLTAAQLNAKHNATQSDILKLPVEVFEIILAHASKHTAYVPGFRVVCKKFKSAYESALRNRLEREIIKKYPEFADKKSQEKLEKFINMQLEGITSIFKEKVVILNSLGPLLEEPIRDLYRKLEKPSEGVNKELVLTMHKQWLKDINYVYLHRQPPKNYQLTKAKL
ncbi:MAG: hypothetical protein JSR17_05150 [Proteobacteria bacterium]|nr:hypothetical protein [Pseudomonadota bacterium]